MYFVSGVFRLAAVVSFASRPEETLHGEQSECVAAVWRRPSTSSRGSYLAEQSAGWRAPDGLALDNRRRPGRESSGPSGCGAERK
jgi:hypothetical protein